MNGLRSIQLILNVITAMNIGAFRLTISFFQKQTNYFIQKKQDMI